MSSPESLSTPETPTATRTLLVAGYSITRSARHPNHIEYECERADVFGATVRYLIAVCDSVEPPQREYEAARTSALRGGRVFVAVARSPGTDWLSWAEFVAALGGAVPNWRALGPAYAQVLRTSARNRPIAGEAEEPWRVFEDAVADGVEFLLGYRVRRLGGRRRGRAVSDLVCRTPDERILVVDVKASAEPFDVTWPGLRPLVEYVDLQKIRQQGQLDVSGALLVAADFRQPPDRLQELAGQFLAETSVPLSYLVADRLLAIIGEVAKRPELRNAIRWSRILCAGGLVSLSVFREELAAAQEGRMGR